MLPVQTWRTETWCEETVKVMTFGTAEQVAIYILLFFTAIFALTETVALLGALAFGLKTLNQKIDVALDAVRPILDKSTEVLGTVQRVTMNVGERADTILNQGEELTEKLSKKVDHTSSIVEKTVTTPLINLSSVMAGVSRGFSVLSRGSHTNGSDTGKSSANGTKNRH